MTEKLDRESIYFSPFLIVFLRMNRSELGSRIYELAHLEGDFLLSSGQRSHEYWDKYQFLSDPELLKEIAQSFLMPLLPPEVEVLAGVNMGGLPIATALSLFSGLPQVFVRKEAKGYGTMKLAEGPNINGRNLIIIEDILSTGHQVRDTARDLRDMQANVEYALSVVEKNMEGQLLARENLQKDDIELISLYTDDELKASFDETRLTQLHLYST